MPPSPRPTSRNQALRERGTTASPSTPYSTVPRDRSSLLQGAPSSSRVSTRSSPAEQDNFRYQVPGLLQRRQTAPVLLQQPRSALNSAYDSAISSNQAPIGAPSNNVARWHRSSSPAPQKLGDTLFRYKPLERNEIRLLRILPGTSPVINCEIIHTSLDNPQKYTAISYAWGDLEDTRCIILEGHEFPVTESLWQGLQRLRSSSTSVLLWADAVCINQRDTMERNYQVQSMTTIYSKAHETAVWLGPEDLNSVLAIQLLHKLVSSDGSPAEIKETIMSHNWRHHFHGLVTLFGRDYWKRLWVVQEVINSSQLTVHCGNSVLPWKTYVRASEILLEHKPDLIRAFMGESHSDGLNGNYPWEIFLCFRGPVGLRDIKFASFGSVGMLRALLHHRSKLCTEPRDRIYGILGVLSAEERSQFPVDYNISTIEVYTNVVDYILSTTGRLDVICASIHYPKHQMIDRLPSWVPDWSYYPNLGPLVSQNSRFCASGQTTAIFSFSRRRRELSISAIRIGEINATGIQLGVPINMSAILVAFFQWRLRLMRVKGSDNQIAHEAFCRTLCLDQASDRWTPPEWVDWTYHSFSTLLQERLPGLELDDQLKFYTADTTPISISAGLREQMFSDYIVGAMAGRRFAITASGLLCLGTGCLTDGDIICVPLGCSTPVVLRQYNQGYLFVGDVYVDGYMYGRAVEELNSGARLLEKYSLQ